MSAHSLMWMAAHAREEHHLTSEDEVSTIKAANHRALHHTGAAAGKQFQSVALSGCSTIFDEAGASLASSVDPELWGRSFQESGLILEDDASESWGARSSSNSQSPPCAPKLRPSVAPGMLPALSLPPALSSNAPSNEGRNVPEVKPSGRVCSLPRGPSPMLLTAFAHIQQPDDFKVAGAEILFEDSDEDEDFDAFDFGDVAEAPFISEEDEDEDVDEEGVFAFQDEDDSNLEGSLDSGSESSMSC
mmetsp:Transcript_16176/g.35019  ORF Transcript_16176/g.35019 Transcript_16176/m.35019 type:complete len:246 (+) Transcript_16176:226-963(+)